MPPTTDTLVVGYGSDLRGDDAVGRRVAERVRAWALPHVRVISAHQLTPDLASPIAEARRVLFIDAHPAAACRCRRVHPLGPTLSATHLGHSGTPQTLLGWARIAYGASPDAWWITLPALTFGLGAGLSPGTEAAMQDAMPAIRRLLEEPVPDRGARAAAVDNQTGGPVEGLTCDD
jgi:hydrogenase maturation protease